MIFNILLILAAVAGGCLGALLSHVDSVDRDRGRFLVRETLSENCSDTGKDKEPSPVRTVRRKWRGTVLTGAILTPLGAGLFVLGLCLWARSFDLTAVWNRFFPDRLSKLAGCGMLLLLFCVLGLLAGFLRAGGPRAFFRRVRDSHLHRGLGLAVLGGGLALALGCAVLAGDPAPTPVRLSEVCCGNFTLKTDPDTGEYTDYIELVNTGNEAVDLGGYFLSDKAKKRNRFRLPELTLGPGEYVVLWADGTGKTGTRSGADIHLNFSLKPGDTVWFSSPHGVLLDQITVPERYKNVSLSRIDGEWVLAAGTPGRANEGAWIYPVPTLEAPVLSLESGFYDEPQTLTITAPAGCEIRYTLDGSFPSAGSLLYTGPLTLTDRSPEPNQVVSQPNTTPDRSGAVTEPVDKGTVLRVACFDADGGQSETVTAVYFIGERFEQYAGRAVLSLVMAPGDLFGTYGIAVTGPAWDAWLEGGAEGWAPTANYDQHGRNWERDGRILLWDEDGTPLLDTACGVRLQGRNSRYKFPKRFTLYARPVYGTGRLFSTPISGAYPEHSVVTRPNVHEVMAQALTAELGLGCQAARPVTVFLNGELYDDTFLRERYDAQYFTNHYGVDRADLVVIDSGELDKGAASDLADYAALMAEIETGDCADPAFYDWVCGRIDVESYAAYVAANLYLNNTDWSQVKNYKLWRTRESRGEGVLDGRWRWLIYDMDSCMWNRSSFGDLPRAAYDIFPYNAANVDYTFLETPLFKSLLKSPAFRELFARTWLEQMNVPFSYARALPLLEEYGLTEDAFWPEFLRDRPARAAEQLVAHIVPEGRVCALTVGVPDPAGGTVRLGSWDLDLSGGTWEGLWVSGVGLTLTAEPAEGWRFLRWEGVEGGAGELRLTPDGNTGVVAVFEPIQ